MKKTYGRTGVFRDVVGNDRKLCDIFSDTSGSSDSSTGKDGGTRKAQKNRTRGKPLADVSNTKTTGTKKLSKNKKQAKPKELTDEAEVPNFSSFDDYSLIVRPVTPIKTHVSISASTSEDNWANYPTQELLGELSNNCMLGSPVASSPQLHSALVPCTVNISRIDTDFLNSRDRLSVNISAAKLGSPILCSPSNEVIQHSIHVSQSYRSNHNTPELVYSPPVTRSSNRNASSCMQTSMETRRAKRLRQRLGESLDNSMSTSTPEQRHRKKSRMYSPGIISMSEDLSHIPSLDVDEQLSASMQQVSLHESLREVHHESVNHESVNHESQAMDNTHQSTSLSLLSTADASQSVLLSSHNYSSSDSGRSALSASLFTASYRNMSHHLDSIMEEVTDEEVTDEEVEESVIDLSSSEPHSNTSIYNTAEDSHTPSSGSYHTPARRSVESGDFSEERMNALITELQQMESPSVSEITRRRREKQILRLCDQKKFLTFTEYMSTSDMEQLTKIGEGVYGEVFRQKKNDEVTIIKIVPMEGECTVNDEPQKRFHEMANEVEITRKLSDVGYNFINTKRVVCTQGIYPQQLLDHWDDFAERKESENDRPDYFTPDQYFVVFEFADGGEALESYEFASAAEGLSVLLQVGWTLAVAEDVCEFEHRDLHWSNILIAKESNPHLHYTFSSNNDTYTIESAGVKVNIIDFTLSRLKKDKLVDNVLYCDLSEDQTLFEGKGDYQFDVYRQMRDVTRNQWKAFHSVTNIFWMRYLADKLLKMKPFPSKRGASPTAAQLKKALMSFYERSSRYLSAVQMVYTDELFTQYGRPAAENNLSE